MQSWRYAFRVGVAPQLTTAGLEALASALERDDPALLRGATTDPPPMRYAADWPVTGCCPVAYPGWRGDGLVTVGQVETQFAAVCERADVALKEPAGTRWLMNWWDETPRQTARPLLLAEVRLALAARAEGG